MVNKNFSVKIVEDHRSVLMVNKNLSVKIVERHRSVITASKSVNVKSVTQRINSLFIFYNAGLRYESFILSKKFLSYLNLS